MNAKSVQVVKIAFLLSLGFVFFKVSSFLLREENQYQLIVELQTPKSDTYQVYWASKENAYEANKFKNVEVKGSTAFQTIDVKIYSKDDINFLRLDVGNTPETVKIKVKDLQIFSRNSHLTVPGSKLLDYFNLNGYLTFDSLQSTITAQPIPDSPSAYDPFICSKDISKMSLNESNSVNLKPILLTILFLSFLTIVLFKIY